MAKQPPSLSRGESALVSTTPRLDEQVDLAREELSLDEFPAESAARLEGFKAHRFELPGYALTRMIPETIGHDNRISDSVASLMELDDEERQALNEELTSVVTALREIEAKNYQVKEDRSGVKYISVPEFSKQGMALRQQLLSRIEKNLGLSRRQIFEMQLLQAPTRLGEFGQESLVLRYPEVIEQNGQSLMTVHIGTMTDEGTENERFQGHLQTFTVEAFQERFAHLFDSK